MSEVVRCSKCGNRVVAYPVGFESKCRLHCSRFYMEVDDNDGCTFGHVGEATTGTYAPEVVITGQSATNGDRFIYG